VAHQSRDLPTLWDGELLDCACTGVNGVGKPCAGERHARIERGPLGKAGEHVGGTKIHQVTTLRWATVSRRCAYCSTSGLPHSMGGELEKELAMAVEDGGPRETEGPEPDVAYG
jgi:hypothetical protein